MSIFRYTTETGSYYDITAERWNKNGGGWERLLEFFAVPDWEADRAEVMEGIVDYAYRHNQHRTPEVGDCIFISSRDAWWLSKRVTKIEELT